MKKTLISLLTAGLFGVMSQGAFAAPELEFDRRGLARQPQLEVGFQVEMPGRFQRMHDDAAIGDAAVLHLLRGHALLVDQHQAAVGEHDHVAHEGEGSFHLLAFGQQRLQFGLELGHRCFAGVAEQAVDQSHARFLER